MSAEVLMSYGLLYFSTQLYTVSQNAHCFRKHMCLFYNRSAVTSVGTKMSQKVFELHSLLMAAEWTLC